jgi:hypothetical protein
VQALATYSVSFSYANALSDQKRHEERITNDIARDIRSLKTERLKNVAVSGHLGVGPGVMNMLAKYRFARGIVFSELKENNFWAAIRLRWAGVDLNHRAMTIDEKRHVVCEMIPDADNQLYSLYRTGDTALLRFKNDNLIC